MVCIAADEMPSFLAFSQFVFDYIESFHDCQQPRACPAVKELPIHATQQPYRGVCGIVILLKIV
jgi:hypothetical protein